MKPYEILEHTADAKFRASGKTLEEAFSNAIRGLSAIVADPDALPRTQRAHIRVEGKDLKMLLFNLLDELLFLMDTERLLPAAAESMRITHGMDGYALECAVAGDDVRKHGGNLKAVTYSEMVVEQEEGLWIIQAVIDI